MPETVIKIENLWKQYRYGVVSRQYLFRDIQSWWARMRGKEDPNAKVGQGLLNPQSACLPKRQRRQAIANPQSADRFWALRNINLEVKQGEIIGVIGRNGAGKSTLLKILSRVTAPTKGSIKIKGRIGSLLEVGTGFHPELTGRENIFLNGAILGMRKSEIKKKFDEIVAFAEIENFIDTPVKRYSSGMYVRLAFAVAAHLDPEILVVDEVLAVGDAQFQKKCLGKMGEVSRNEGRTVLFVSHNMIAIKSLCINAVLLDSGVVKTLGETNEVVNDYLAVTAIINEQNWENPDQAPGNESIRFKKAKISIDAAEGHGEQIRVDTPLLLEFEFWNFCENADLNLSLHLHTVEGLLVFNSVSESRKCGKGIVRGVCRIPANLLNDEKYSVMIMVVIDRSRPLCTVPDILRFEVADTEREGGWMGKWGGVVRPRIIWEMASIPK